VPFVNLDGQIEARMPPKAMYATRSAVCCKQPFHS
jgi:hypothetical protein